MIKNKDRYKSKTMISSIALIVILLNKQFGIELPEEQIFTILETGTELLLGVMAIYGRVTATTIIK